MVISSKEQHPPLTAREVDVLRQIAARQSNKLIARKLGLSVRTVETHRMNIKRKLGLTGHAELVRYALAHMAPAHGDSQS